MGVQFTVQSTPAFEESLVTFAVIEVVSFTPREVGGVGEIATPTELLEEHATSINVTASVKIDKHQWTLEPPRFSGSEAPPRSSTPLEPLSSHPRKDANDVLSPTLQAEFLSKYVS